MRMAVLALILPIVTFMPEKRIHEGLSNHLHQDAERAQNAFRRLGCTTPS